MTIESRTRFGEFYRSKHWILANIFCVIFFLYFASKLWAPRGEEKEPASVGIAFSYGLTVLPFMALGVLVNLLWLGGMLWRLAWCRKWSWISFAVFVGFFFVWQGVFSYDNSRKYSGNDLSDTGTISLRHPHDVPRNAVLPKK